MISLQIFKRTTYATIPIFLTLAIEFNHKNKFIKYEKLDIFSSSICDGDYFRLL